SAGRRLDFHLARPATSAARDATRNGVVIAHELPVTPGSAGSAGSTYPQLADRVAADTGWMALTFACRGAGRSPGQFSPGGWLEDLRAAIEMLRAETATVWLAGFGFGGVLALRAGADDPAIGGVAVLATPSDLSPWIRSPATLATLAHEAGLVESATPPGLEQWADELKALDPPGAATALQPRPVLIVRGSADETVSAYDARVLADAAVESAELRVIALLLGWLTRQTG